MATPTDEDKTPSSPDEESSTATAPPAEIDEEDDDDDSPDPVRLGILATVLLVLISVWVWTIMHPPPKKFYTDIPGLKIDTLTPAQRDAVLKEANAMACDCGSPTCNYDVAECRNMMNTTCDVSLKLAGNIIQKVTGKPAVYTQQMPPEMQGTMGAPPPPSGAPMPPSAAPQPPSASGAPASAAPMPPAASPDGAHHH